eukprot:TRINITY_DN26414_c0_g1_i1.p1 TRINITY_DN26414_c0_g1~~TRINITY_DN26414_c0_g1_i1.p1  ORF type:complete len:393 (+),score=126.18 TRINITY_DN26414_c0_g1_i1:298-1476(+)
MADASVNETSTEAEQLRMQLEAERRSHAMEVSLLKRANTELQEDMKSLMQEQMQMHQRHEQQMRLLQDTMHSTHLEPMHHGFPGFKGDKVRVPRRAFVSSPGSSSLTSPATRSLGRSPEYPPKKAKKRVKGSSVRSKSSETHPRPTAFSALSPKPSRLSNTYGRYSTGTTNVSAVSEGVSSSAGSPGMRDLMDLFQKREEVHEKLLQAHQLQGEEKEALAARVYELEEEIADARRAVHERSRIVGMVHNVLRNNDTVRTDLSLLARDAFGRRGDKVDVQDRISRAADAASTSDRLLRQTLDAFTEAELMHAGVTVSYFSSPIKRTPSARSARTASNVPKTPIGTPLSQRRAHSPRSRRVINTFTHPPPMPRGVRVTSFGTPARLSAPSGGSP